MGKKLYVGSLPYSISEDELREHFSVAGNVESAAVITDKFSGRSKGFGFVEMATEEEAQKAIDTLNGSDLGGRNITVSEARPQREGGERKSYFGAPREGAQRGGFRKSGGFRRESRY